MVEKYVEIAWKPDTELFQRSGKSFVKNNRVIWNA